MPGKIPHHARTRGSPVSRSGKYRRFIRRTTGIVAQQRRRDGEHADSAQRFVVRTLLMHDYRRLLLRNPQLPATLLPADWPGPAARALCRNFYRHSLRAAERHLVATLEGHDGRLPPATAAFYRRFGGLRR